MNPCGCCCTRGGIVFQSHKTLLEGWMRALCHTSFGVVLCRVCSRREEFSLYTIDVNSTKKRKPESGSTSLKYMSFAWTMLVDLRHTLSALRRIPRFFFKVILTMKRTRDLSPPQTYSRIFRPWDLDKTQSSHKDQEKLGALFGVSVKSENVEKCENGEKDLLLVHHDPMLQCQKAYPEYLNCQQFIDYQDCYGMVPLLDPLTQCMMEQEYARVIAEDAQTKILNLRRQRPKKFKCPHCDVAFSNNGQLKGHIRIHTGERPFKCDDSNCGKTFTRNEELTRHKRIHTGLRPFACTVCGKKFGRRDHLKKHTKIHFAPERLFPSTVFLPYTFLPTY